MGMFDYVKCDAKHPLAADVNQGQEKQFRCFLETVWIDEQGRLLLQRCRYERTPKDELPYPDMPLIGSIKTIQDGWDHQQHYTGEIDTGEWAAVFVRGKLIGFRMWDDPSQFVEFCPPDTGVQNEEAG